MTSIVQFGENLAALEDRLVTAEIHLGNLKALTDGRRNEFIKLIDKQYQETLNEIDTVITLIANLRGVETSST